MHCNAAYTDIVDMCHRPRLITRQSQSVKVRRRAEIDHHGDTWTGWIKMNLSANNLLFVVISFCKRWSSLSLTDTLFSRHNSITAHKDRNSLIVTTLDLSECASLNYSAGVSLHTVLTGKWTGSAVYPVQCWLHLCCHASWTIKLQPDGDFGPRKADVETLDAH